MNVPTSIIDRAKEIAYSQGHLANSPGESDEYGNIRFCAASCIALAALEEHSNSLAIESFYQKILTEEKEQFVPQLVQSYGIDKEYTLKAMQQNDNLRPPERLDWFMNLEND